MVDLWLQNSFKIDIVDIYSLYEVDNAAGKQNFQIF